MSRVLVLGGTGEGLALARRLGPHDIYSLAGLGRRPEGLACQLRVGGYQGADGLCAFLRREGIDLLIDATHPYAAQMSRHAREASLATGIALWAIRRPGWEAGPGDDWRFIADWAALLPALAGFRRPLFTLGRSPLQHLHAIGPDQHWTIRCLDPQPPHPQTTMLADRGPYRLEQELALFQQLDIDVLISKNSGGEATAAKLEVARRRGCPVLMLQRPPLPPADRCFSDAASLLEDWP